MANRTKGRPAPEFRELLRKAGMTLSMLERRAGLGRNDSWRYAKGTRSPRLSTVIRMSEAIGVDVGLVARSLMDARERWESRRDRLERVADAIRAARLAPGLEAGGRLTG